MLMLCKAALATREGWVDDYDSDYLLEDHAWGREEGEENNETQISYSKVDDDRTLF